jgi:hypothetical protein
MADASQIELDALIGRSVLAMESLARLVRHRIVRRLADVRGGFSVGGNVQIAREVLAEFEPIIAQAITDAELAAWITGTMETVDALPAAIVADLENTAGGALTAPVTPPSVTASNQSVIRFPRTERAARDLETRDIVNRATFDRLELEARNRAFTVAGEIGQDALSTIRDALVDTTRDDLTLRGFRRRLGEDLEGSFIGPAHLETVFRTNIQTAFHRGLQEMADNPVVADVFPYQAYDAIRDGRVRPNHLALESLGLNGTNIYRRDDPFWLFWTPPNGFNCFSPGTAVSGELEWVSKASYAGKMIEIVTRSSAKPLTVTPNHPVLTLNGFRPACELREGQQLIRHAVDDHRRFGADNAIGRSVSFDAPFDASRFPPQVSENDHIPVIANVFSSLAVVRDQLRFPTCADYFHGDGKMLKDNVDVVRAHRYLGIDLQPSFNQSVGNFTLPFSDPFFSGFGNQRKRRIAVSFSTFGDPSRAALANGRGSIHSRPFDFLSIGPTANLNAAFPKLIDQGGPAATLLISQLFHGFPGAISLDEIVQIREYDFCGHVYDCESSSGWVSANGLIVSNCPAGATRMAIR